MAALYICQLRRPQAFPSRSPLALLEHYKQNKNLLSQLGTPRGDKEVNLGKAPPDTAAQAYAFHYYVCPYDLFCCPDALLQHV
jgi:hypothetical protein